MGAHDGRIHGDPLDSPHAMSAANAESRNRLPTAAQLEALKHGRRGETVTLLGDDYQPESYSITIMCEVRFETRDAANRWAENMCNHIKKPHNMQGAYMAECVRLEKIT